MLVQIISRYLETNKRLVIPQLGAFIVKTPGESVVFSELLKRDDGILHNLLQTEGMNEMEAAGEINRFVFEVRHATERGVGFPLPGFGLLKPGPNGTITFSYDPAPVQPTIQNEITTQPTTHKHSGCQTPTSIQTTDSHKTRTRTTEPKISPSVKLNPEPCVKGLRYGKAPKNTNAYTYIEGRRRIDRFLLLAIVASVIAVGIIAYVFITSSDGEMPVLKQQIEQTVQPAANTTTPTAGEDVPTPNPDK